MNGISTPGDGAVVGIVNLYGVQADTGIGIAEHSQQQSALSVEVELDRGIVGLGPLHDMHEPVIDQGRGKTGDPVLEQSLDLPWKHKRRFELRALQFRSREGNVPEPPSVFRWKCSRRFVHRRP